MDLSRLTLPEELQVREDVEKEEVPSPLPAGFSRRAVAVLVDSPILLVLTVLAMILASFAAVGGGTAAGELTRQIDLLASGTAIVAAFGMSLAYHVVCWGQGGQTPGKILMGVQVVGADGKEIGYGRALLRWVGYLVAALPLGAGFVVVLFHSEKRGLHDLVAGTRVVRVNSESGR